MGSMKKGSCILAGIEEAGCFLSLFASVTVVDDDKTFGPNLLVGKVLAWGPRETSHQSSVEETEERATKKGPRGRTMSEVSASRIVTEECLSFPSPLITAIFGKPGRRCVSEVLLGDLSFSHA